MKIIFSRKGFDKSSGGVASPIFPDGGLCSIPIPAPWDQKRPPVPKYQVRFKDLSYDSVDLGSIVEDLSFNARMGKSRVKSTGFCHLDPDLIRGDLHRKAGWRPIFGQGNQAATHLLSHGVREGDLFLFFGWFRRVRDVDGHLSYDAARENAHLILGWLQIGEIWCQFEQARVVPKWARYHPHLWGIVEEYYNLTKPVDVVFIANRRLDLPGLKRWIQGGGIFDTFHADLCLSRPGERRGWWRLPRWMYPFPGRAPLTYHGDRKKWKKSGKWTFLRTVGRGQEFILDLESHGYPETYPADKAYKWLAEIFRHA